MINLSSVSSKQFVKLNRDVLRSDAWRSQGINERRILDYLMTEYLANAGTNNGSLMAPREQLEIYGVGARHISSALNKLIDRGLIDCRRGRGKKASLYALTWLPMADGGAPSNRWMQYINPSLRPVPTRKVPVDKTGVGKSQIASDGKSSIASEGKLQAA
jgi:hypothetical protein